MDNIANINTLEYENEKNGDKFEANIARVSTIIKSDKLGYNVTTIPPGKRAWPLHAHYINDELFFILEGSGTIIIGKEKRSISKGDFISIPANPNTAHQIINNSTKKLTYLGVSTMLEPEVVVYPNSNKLGIRIGRDALLKSKTSKGMRINIDMSQGVDYWDGEK